MPQRERRLDSFPAELVAAHRRKLEAGLAGVAAWEAEASRLSAEERASGEEWARRVLAGGGDPVGS